MTKPKGKIITKKQTKNMKIMKHLGEAYPSCMCMCRGVKKYWVIKFLSVTPQKPSRLYLQIWLNSSVNCLSPKWPEIA